MAQESADYKLDRKVFWSAGVLILGNAVDIVTTAAFLHVGGEEWSPIARHFIEQNGFIAMGAIKMAIISSLSLIALGVYGFMEKEDKKLALFVFRLAAIYYAGINIGNLNYFLSLQRH